MTTQISSLNRYNIISGPSADRLFDSLKYAYDSRAKVRVKFTIKKTGDSCAQKVSVVIGGISHEDNSGSSFNITGYLGNKRFEGHYNSNKRGGYLCTT